MPLFSNFSENIMSKNQTFLLYVIPMAGNVNQHDGILKSRKEGLRNFLPKENSSSEILADKRDMIDEVSDVNCTTKPTTEGSDIVYQKLLIIVTPTYARPFQAYYLNRLGQTLKLVQAPLLWVVVEMPSQSPETADILRKNSVMYRHLVCNENETTIRNRGLHQKM
ncbi:hypothetical protein MKX03_006240 [Papaver bracteatum]|nr:hypothetical protein MKX03_006240 [Papaver bracteatum]